ncbi:hypothetical protein TorRG33x02_097440 [Trema orientale]|uniref:Uncharacterized protein n=1 Tax=Trema orientale TaxID=63057 RepID=A0A2P5F9N6_TREOI|nr:hypothetical protein TorRG33x02_097440 [Trema orientale]
MMASFNDERDHVINSFIQKSKAAGPRLTVDGKSRVNHKEEARCKTDNPDSSHTDNIHIPDSPCEENNNYHNEENNRHLKAYSTPNRRSGEVIIKWVDTHFLEIERKMDIAVNELFERQTIFEKKVLSELQSKNDKSELIISMIMRDPARRNDPLKANIDDCNMKFDHCTIEIHVAI